jgi:hypothetical protein
VFRKSYKGLGVYDERTKTKKGGGKFCVSARNGEALISNIEATKLQEFLSGFLTPRYWTISTHATSS